MGMPWYEWGNIKNRLLYFGKAMQGISPYRVLVEPDEIKCPTGYCDFSKKEIAINPSLFSDLQPKDQYQLSKALLVHEAGHRRFTKPKRMKLVTHQISNILEDERIERQMCFEFAGVRWLVKKLSEKLYEEAHPIDEKSDSPGEVVAYFLQLRWARALGKPVKGNLSTENQKLWEKVKPLVYEAWGAETSETVHENAKKIARILGIKEIVIPVWVNDVLRKLGSLEGKRADGDPAEDAADINPHNTPMQPTSPYEDKTDEDFEPEPFDGEVAPTSEKVGKGDEAIEPKPYLQLEEKVKHLAGELINELSFDETPSAPEPVERGGRLSVREYVRDKNRPFLEEEAPGKAPPLLTVKVIIDHSLSLNLGSHRNRSRITSIAEAVMTLHLVCLELGITHEVWVTPQQVKIADFNSGERGKALIAGLVPALCGYEDMGLALKNHALPMTECPEDIKLVLCLTDGICNDAELGKEICSALRGKVEVIGLLLNPEDGILKHVTYMFGQDRVIACRPKELPCKLGNILRAIRGL